MIYRDQLEAVYRLIERPEAWTQGAYARDAAGEDICDEDGEPDEAACWCLWGAAFKCGIAKTHEYDFVGALGFKSLIDPNEFNDSHTHAEVLALLQSAIDRAPVRP